MAKAVTAPIRSGRGGLCIEEIISPLEEQRAESSRSAFTSGGQPGGPAVSERRGTSLRSVIPPDSLWLATAYEPAPRSPCAQRSPCRVHSQRHGSPARHAGKPVGSVPELAGSALARFHDLASHGLRQRSDERGRHYRATQRLVDGFRNGIRCYSE